MKTRNQIRIQGSIRPACLICVIVFGLMTVLGVGCSDSDGDGDQSLTASYTATPTTGGAPLDVEFDGSASTGSIVSYAWSFGDGATGVQSRASHTYTTAGYYSVTLTVTDDNCATHSVTGGITVTTGTGSSLRATYTATPSTGIAPLDVEFDGSASTGSIVSYAWSFGDGVEAVQSRASHTYTTVGYYSVKLTVTDHNGATDSVTGGITVTAATGFCTVSGTIHAPANAAIDSDVNDPYAPYASNDEFDEAQAICNPAIVGGYVNAAGTGEPGRSQASGDPTDFFQVSLAKDQPISLYTAEPSAADLNLYDEARNLIDASAGTDSIQSLTAPSTGTFFVEVYASDSASNYNLTIGQSTGSDAVSGLRLGHEFVPGEAIVRFKDSVLPAGSGHDMAAQAAAVGMKAKAGAPGRAMLLSFNDEEGTEETFRALGIDRSNQDMHHEAADPRTQRKLDTLRAIKALRGRPDVLHADPNYILRAYQIPDDQYYSHQWHYPLINLPQAWDLTTGDSDVIVAVIDTGVLLDHPDLQGQLIAGYDFIVDPACSLDGDGIDNNPDDPGDDGQNGSSFHGTHVAGTVAAATNNGRGVAGVAWSTKIMPVRVLGKGGGTGYDVMQGVRYAAGLENDSGTLPDRRADIINLSLGGGSYLQTSQEVYTDARNAGVIIIAAAGNESTGSLSYPASYDGVVSVSAVDINSGLASYSNYGTAIDVAAPGGDSGDVKADYVLSTCADDTSGYIQMICSFKGGTSMASPHVAGVAALMKAVYRGLTPGQLDSFLHSGDITTDLGESGRDDSFGWGLIDAYKAVVAAQDLAGGGGTVPATLVVNPLSLNLGGTLANGVLSVRNGGSDTLSDTLTVSGVTDDAQWLIVSGTDVDANGLGDYTASVDRAGLSDGTYTATITFASSANTVDVAVIMQVGGAAADSGNAGYHYVLLLDSGTFKTVDQVAVEADNGTYPYSFTGVSAGTYMIYAGTDSDNDSVVGDAGEASGAFMSIDQPMSISVNRDLTGLDFSTGFVTNMPTWTACEDAEPQFLPRRIKAKKVWK